MTGQPNQDDEKVNRDRIAMQDRDNMMART
jgi:hypothetical protein